MSQWYVVFGAHGGIGSALSRRLAKKSADPTAAARVGLGNHEAISAAKAGIESLTLAASASYASKQIRVNCVAPGMSRTPLTAKLLQNEMMAKASAGSVGSDRRARRCCFRDRVAARCRAGLGHWPGDWYRRRPFPNSVSVLMRL